MSTIWEKFPGISNLRERVTPYPIKARFSAALSAGKYVFNPLTLVWTLNLPQNMMGVIDGVAFSANVDQLIFSNSIDPTVNNGFFNLNLIRGGNKNRANMAPFAFASFSQGMEFVCNFEPTGTVNGKEDFYFSLSGGMIQTPDLVGVPSIDILAVANLYLCKNDIK